MGSKRDRHCGRQRGSELGRQSVGQADSEAGSQ